MTFTYPIVFQHRRKMMGNSSITWQKTKFPDILKWSTSIIKKGFQGCLCRCIHIRVLGWPLWVIRLYYALSLHNQVHVEYYLHTPFIGDILLFSPNQNHIQTGLKTQFMTKSLKLRSYSKTFFPSRKVVRMWQ